MRRVRNILRQPGVLHILSLKSLHQKLSFFGNLSITSLSRIAEKLLVVQPLQKLPPLQNPKLHHRVHKNSFITDYHLEPVKSSPVFTSYFFVIHSKHSPSYPQPVLSSDLLFQISNLRYMRIYLFSHACFILSRSHNSLCDHPSIFL